MFIYLYLLNYNRENDALLALCSIPSIKYTTIKKKHTQ